MRKVCKMMLILLTLFFVCSCDRVKGNYNNTKMVSSEVETKFYKNNDGSLGNNDVLKANVMIYNTNYSSFLGVKYKESSTYGSGVIFKTDDNYYYVLTNNHVICKESSYSNQSIYIEDYFFNRYNGEVVYSKASYDLAVFRF